MNINLRPYLHETKIASSLYCVTSQRELYIYSNIVTRKCKTTNTYIQHLEQYKIVQQIKKTLHKNLKLNKSVL